jgi:hypothetical protein
MKTGGTSFLYNYKATVPLFRLNANCKKAALLAASYNLLRQHGLRVANRCIFLRIVGYVFPTIFLFKYSV